MTGFMTLLLVLVASGEGTQPHLPERYRGPLQLHRRLTLSDPVGPVHLQSRMRVAAACRIGPADSELPHPDRPTQPDLKREAPGAERASGAHRSTDGSRPAAGIHDLELHPRADGGTIGRAALEREPDPGIAAPARILEQRAGEPVAGERSAQNHVDVLVAVAIEIRECGAVALPEMPEASGQGDLLEPLSLHAPEHSIGDDGVEVGIPGADVEVQPAVVVEVAVVAPHRVDGLAHQAGAFGGIREGAVTVVPEEPGAFDLDRQSEILAGHGVLKGGGGMQIVAQHQEILPAVLIEIPEPG